jgi:hexosaminidase
MSSAHPLQLLLLALLLPASALGPNNPAHQLWPLAASASCTPGDLPLATSFTIRTTSTSDVATQAAQRYTSLFAPGNSSVPQAAASRTLREVVLVVANSSEALNAATRYDYTLALLETGTEVIAVAASPYAAVAALETVGQLLTGCTEGSGCTHFGCSALELSDAPTFRHRGLMIDAGRRHYPPALVKSLIEGMAMVKLNVLHLHFADFGNSEFAQFGAGGIRIESKRFPQLTANLSDSAGNRLFYTQDEVGCKTNI